MHIIERLKNAGVHFEAGLSETEMASIQECYKISFPPDLYAILKIALPVSDGFVNWRDSGKGNIEKIINRLNRPLEGMIFDLEHNGFWLEAWGTRPDQWRLSLDSRGMIG